MSFEHKSGADVITFNELNAELYDRFKPTLTWEARCRNLGQTMLANKSFVIGIKEPEASAPLMTQLIYENRDPRSIIEMRLPIKDAIIGHASERGKSELVFSGRSGNDSLYRGDNMRLGLNCTLWATGRKLWDESIGTSMNNPFYYLVTRNRDYNLGHGRSPGELFVPVIAAFDTKMLESAPGNEVDRTSWRVKNGQHPNDAIVALYYFSPRDYILI